MKSKEKNHDKVMKSKEKNHDKVMKSKELSEKLLKIDNNDKKYYCKFCNKEFKHKQSKYDHQKKYCKTNKLNNSDNKDKELELQILQHEEKILKLKLKLENSTKIDNITLKQLNKKLLERNNLIKNSTINSNNKTQTNNIINNTFQLVGFAKEEVVELLTIQEKKQIT
jgi:hypothetical protein